ncbi:MAG TPA: glycine betaine ABC transporter substrate-binding protein [Chthoniobacterales bacterium]|jgi:osmoprotectant transport system permease protein|nr:glycine betaine ABC transporter substrate-binding protein [Chthoniobacterales bacterium]
MRGIRKAGKQEAAGKPLPALLPRTFSRLLIFSFSCVPAFLIIPSSPAAPPILIGSKKFTESYVLAEIAKRTIANAGVAVDHRQGMGGTIILWQALRSDQIAAYPEYTGTIAEEILKLPPSVTAEQLREELAKAGVGMTNELGFNNTYALVMRRDVAEQKQIRRIGDLRNHPELKIGLTHEFMDRRDGWRPLSEKYQLGGQNVVGLDHGLGYEALRNGSIAVKDAYSTDAKIGENDLVVLEDDKQFFPQYKAVFLYRLALPPNVVANLRSLEGAIDERRMIDLNGAAERLKNYAEAADLFFSGASPRAYAPEPFTAKLWRWTSRHLQLAGVSLLLAIVVGVPLGIAASRGGPVGHVILAVVGAIQTVPSLALLALLVPIPFFGISPLTAIVALFLYGLLPIVRNTATGLQDIAQPIRESAVALGLEPATRLWKIFLPMASRSILAGIKTSAVINIGTATLAALIGAGGLGEPILSGLNLNDHVTILQGAIPAAVLALLVQWTFDLLDRFLIPKGLRLSGI